MPFAYRLQDYYQYREAVGGATIIDVSRRTDPARIPRLWANLDEVLRQGTPPWIIHLWTKNPGGVLNLGRHTLHQAREMGVTLAAQVTITGLAGTMWEPRVPRDGLERLPELIDCIGGPNHITWRYDPIIPTVHRRDAFVALVRRMARLGARRGVINFIAPPGRYKRVDRRLAQALPAWSDGMAGYDDAWRLRVAIELVGLASEHGLSVGCCAESAGLAESVTGLRKAACADHDWFVALSRRDPGLVTHGGSRPGCGCARTFDVGSYGHWRACHGCLYCYAG